MRYPNIIELEISGRYALFTDPLTKAGGEKCSYPIPTYEALKGIMCSIYWVPAIEWVIDAVRIMEPIRTEPMSVPVRRYFRTSWDMSVYTYLKNVRYRVRAHFIPHDPTSFTTDDEHHHYRAALRMLKRGGRREPFLGTADCPCSAVPCSFHEGSGFYDDVCIDLGMMHHGFSYRSGDSTPYAVRFFRCRMENGIVYYPPPQECTLIQQLSQGAHHALV